MMSIHGAEHIRQALGKQLTGARRCVFSLGCANDAFGHGITELTFENMKLVIRPGPNEDYLIVEAQSFDPGSLDPEYWTPVDLVRDHGWQPAGLLKHVNIFTDGIEDVALVFHFDSGDRFSLVLHDTDASLARELELFETGPDSVLPTLKTRIAE
jgi:hypothetical protein